MLINLIIITLQNHYDYFCANYLHDYIYQFKQKAIIPMKS